MLTIPRRMRIVDWSLAAILACEALLVTISQYPANGAPALEAVSVATLAYFAVRIAIRAPTPAAWLGGLFGIGGAWLALSGISQFASGTEQLSAVGLTDFVAFRSRLIRPIRGWLPGECYTLFLLALPFACAAAVFLWRIGKRGLAIFSLVPPTLIAAALVLSLSRAVFWSTVVFFFVACVLMTGYRVIGGWPSFEFCGSLGEAVAPAFAVFESWAPRTPIQRSFVTAETPTSMLHRWHRGCPNLSNLG